MYLRISYIIEKIDFANLHTCENLIKYIDRYYEDITLWIQKIERIHFSDGFLKQIDEFGEESKKKIMQLTLYDL